MTLSSVKVAIIGGGPAGVAAALAASYDGVSVLLIENETHLGGKLNQSIQNSFGTVRFEDAVTGPEYAFYDISALNETKTIVLLQTSVIDITRIGNTFQLTLCNRHGIAIVEAATIVLATGCRERTLCEMGIHGTRPAGLLTAGTVQHYLNVLGQLPVNICVVYGTDNLSLETAQRLTIQGSKVLAVYEQNDTPKGYLHNVSRNLFDLDIPLFFNHAVTRVFGSARLRAVELARVDSIGKPIRDSQLVVRCDGLIVSGGLIPDNELALSLGATICERTGGPLCDQNMMTMVEGVYSCGNALYVSDLIEHITESGEIAGQRAARYIAHSRNLVEVLTSNDFLAIVPQYLDCEILHGETIFYFNVASKHENVSVQVFVDNTEVFTEQYDYLIPSETVRISVAFTEALTPENKVSMRIT